MTDTKLTLGQAIDQIVSALSGLDQKHRATAISAACSVLDLDIPQSRPSRQASTECAPGVPPQGASPPAASTKSDDTGERKSEQRSVVLDIRRLKDEKKPSSSRQMAALVAYYLQEHAPDNERKSEIGTEDLERYFKQAAYKLPQNIAQTLIDSKKSGYLESVDRGVYRLTPVGYNLIVHSLPTGKEQ